MTAIGFNTDGLPSFKIGSKHLHAKGDIFAMKSLFGSSIRTKNGLIVKAFKNLSLVANSDRKHSSAFYISKWIIFILIQRFEVRISLIAEVIWFSRRNSDGFWRIMMLSASPIKMMSGPVEVEGTDARMVHTCPFIIPTSLFY